MRSILSKLLAMFHTYSNNDSYSLKLSEYILWLVSIMLILPMIVVYAIHFFPLHEGLHPTGFLQSDQFYYMANAREHFDSGSFTLSYGLPFSRFEDTPRIYFQPLFLVLGTIHHFSGWQPGYIYALFGLFAALVCVRIAIALYEDIVGLKSAASWIGLLFFIWGGGVLCLAGIAHALITSQNIPGGGYYYFEKIFHFDPFDGFWFLNLGRNFYFSVEAFYHAIFLGTVLLIFRKKYYFAVVLLALMGASHPFTGLQLLLIVTCWGFSNRLVLQKKLPGFTFLSISVVFILLHLGYYLLFLKISPEHRLLLEAWSIGWKLPIESQVFAYAPLLLLILWGLFRRRGDTFPFEDNRFFFLAIWALVSVLLANHDIFMRPIQPLHFTRGYVWIPLFLMAARPLVALMNGIIKNSNLSLKIAILLVVSTVALSDNLLWFGRHIYSSVSGRKSFDFHLTDNEKDVLNLMNSMEYRQALVVSNDPFMGYVTIVYSPLRSWASHWYNTPEFNKRVGEINDFFMRGEIQPDWNNKHLFVITRASADHQWKGNIISTGLRPVFKNSKYVVYSGTISKK